jgi:protoheme IX farnesyltransferase
MLRTCQRPLVLGLNPNIALAAGISLGTIGIAGMYYYNPLTAILGGTIWAGYLFVYTKMKAQSESNTFVGSIVGSLPVYLGWAASGRSMCMV